MCMCNDKRQYSNRDVFKEHPDYEDTKQQILGDDIDNPMAVAMFDEVASELFDY